MRDLSPETDFAGYRIEEVIGRGGMGVVYRARDRSLNRPVAIKLLNDSSASDPQLRERFEREAQMMAALDHPNVIPIYAAGEHEGHLYIVMRYVDGTDLAHLLRSQGRLSAEESARIAAQVARALDAAHARGLVHRDIKPANVLLSGDHVYLSDFGITRLVDEHIRSTDSGNWIGTVDYMSPEHLRGEPTDALSDVYSLGCLLYTCLTGTPPFHRDSTPATINAQLNDPAPKPSLIRGVPRRFDAVLAQALAKRPQDRYRNAGRLATAALAAAQGKRPARVREARPNLAEQPTRIAPSQPEPSQPQPPDPQPPEPELPEREISKPVLPDPELPKPEPPEPELSKPEPPEPGHELVGAARPDTRTLIAGRDTRVDRRARTTPETAPDPVAAAERDANRQAVIMGLAAVVVVAIVAVILLIAGGGGGTPTGPLTAPQITAVVHSFASDYGHRDRRSLGTVLAVDVTRVAPTATQHGRAAVLSAYEQQFTAQPVPRRYVLSNLRVMPGWAGRASGNYTLTLSGGSTLTGHVTFGIERVDGRAEVALIATS